MWDIEICLNLVVINRNKLHWKKVLNYLKNIMQVQVEQFHILYRKTPDYNFTKV